MARFLQHGYYRWNNILISIICKTHKRSALQLYIQKKIHLYGIDGFIPIKICHFANFYGGNDNTLLGYKDQHFLQPIDKSPLQGKDSLADVFEEPLTKIPQTYVSSGGYQRSLAGRGVCGCISSDALITVKHTSALNMRKH